MGWWISRAAAARGGPGAGQHRPRPARPGALPAVPRRPARGGGPRRGRPRLLARRARLPQRQARRAAPGRLRRRDGPAARAVHLAVRAVRRAPAQQRPGPGRGRGQGRPRRSPTTTTTPASGCCASATAPRSRTPACRRRSTPSGRGSRSCSTSPTSTRPWWPTAWRSPRPACASPCCGVSATSYAEATLAVPDVAPRVPGGRRRPAHRAPRPAAGRDAAPHPLAPGGDVVMTGTHDVGTGRDTRAWRVASRVLDPELPSSRSRTSASCATSPRTTRDGSTCRSRRRTPAAPRWRPSAPTSSTG